MKSATIRSEIRRLATFLSEGLEDMSLDTHTVSGLVGYIEAKLYPAADGVTVTKERRDLLEALDRVQYAAEQYIEAAGSDDSEAHAEGITVALESLRGATDVSRLGEARRSALREELAVQPGDVKKVANDSVDVALDSFFQKASDTLDASGDVNKEPDPDDPGSDQAFSASDFASDIATLVDRTNTLLDLRATIARRAFNHVAERFGADAAENFKQILSGNFDIELESDRDVEGERFADRPLAVGSGGSAGVSGGGGGEGAP